MFSNTDGLCKAPLKKWEGNLDSNPYIYHILYTGGFSCRPVLTYQLSNRFIFTELYCRFYFRYQLHRINIIITFHVNQFNVCASNFSPLWRPFFTRRRRPHSGFHICILDGLFVKNLIFIFIGFDKIRCCQIMVGLKVGNFY